MAALPIPNGRSQFIDANGRPLAGGKIYHYTPGTSSPKDTYQDLAATILNTNPVALDPSGEATILGIGAYRQVVLDSAGNQIWDQVTSAPTAVPALPLAGGTLTGSLTVPSLNDTGGQLFSVAPFGDPVSTLTSLNVQGTTLSTTVREYLAAVSLISNKRSGAAASVSPTAALFTGIAGQPGTGDIWAHRTVLQQDSASGAYNAIGHEIQVVNNVGARGDALGAAGLAAPVTYGLAITGSGNRSTSAILVTGPGSQIFNRGLTFTQNSVQQSSIQDLTTSVRSYEIMGTHFYGIDGTSANFTGAALMLGNGHAIKGRDLANVTDMTMLLQSGANLLIGDPATTAIISYNTFLPSSDNTRTIGNAGFRWSAVWAANGTIQTSDASLKTDIERLSDLPAWIINMLLDRIEPIVYRWKIGGKDALGNDIPGKRLHWGWDAARVGEAFEAVGLDFGGYIEDMATGTRHMRPDQLVPVLWQAVRYLTARVSAIDGRN